MAAARWCLVAVGLLAALASVGPHAASNEALVRITDFPRLQVGVVLLAVLALTPLLLPRRRRATWAFGAVVATALASQVWAVLPYTPLHPPQALRAPSCDEDAGVSLIAANVLYSNRDAGPLLRMVATLEPDLVLLSETDAWWDAALAPLNDAYAGSVAQPQDNHYGMHLFTNLPLIDPQVRRLVEEGVPSIHTGVRLPNGSVFDLYGLHPRPPPVSDTEERDAELLIVAEEVRRRGRPAVVAGDMNDVAWSASTRLFQHVSGLLDPRIGRGFYNTFPVGWPGLRWPLDYVFFGKTFTLVELRVLPPIGSDHFPLLVSLCLGGATAAAQDAPKPTEGDLEEAHETIREGRRDEAQDEADE